LIRSVQPIQRFSVLIEFDTGEQKLVDLEPLLHGPVFEPLRHDLDLFRAMRVDAELGTLVWPNGADLDPDVLYGSHVPAWMETVEAAS